MEIQKKRKRERGGGVEQVERGMEKQKIDRQREREMREGEKARGKEWSG